MIMLSLFLNLNAQSYNGLWRDVNKSLENRLPQSAEVTLNKIEQKAIKENNQKELLKTFLYRFKIFSLQDENPIEASINFAEKNISRLQEPEKSIFNLAMASLCECYLNENDNMTPEVINQYYENALSDVELLQNTPINSYINILTNNSIDQSTDIEPTLYDYTIHKIINNYQNNNLNDKALNLYNELISFDEKRNFKDAKIYNEIYKLKLENEISYNFFNSFKSPFPNPKVIKRLVELERELDIKENIETKLPTTLFIP